VLWSKNYIIVFFLLPYLLFIGAIFLYFYANAGHVLLQLVVLGLFAHFFLQFSVLLNPALPFSQPPRKGQRTANVMLPVLFGPFAALLMLWVFARWVYPNPAVLFSTLAALAGAGGLLEGVLRRQIRRRVVSLEYQG
jgi:hypothetical protein